MQFFKYAPVVALGLTSQVYAQGAVTAKRAINAEAAVYERQLTGVGLINDAVDAVSTAIATNVGAIR